jgi:regulator of replication initiation timing
MTSDHDTDRAPPIHEPMPGDLDAAITNLREMLGETVAENENLRAALQTQGEELARVRCENERLRGELADKQAERR